MHKKIISLIIVIAILSSFSAVAFAVDPDAAYQYLSYLNTGWGTWTNDNTNHKISSASYNSYGVNSWNRQLSNLIILADNNAQARDATIVQELKKLTNNTSTGGGMIYILNQILNKIGSITSSGTLLYEVHQLANYWGSSTGTGVQKVTSIDNNVDIIQQILGSSASSGNIANIADALSYSSANTNSTDLIYYIFNLGNYWNKTGPSSSNNAYYTGGNWFKYMLEYQSDIVNAVNNKSFDFSTTVPYDLKTGWGTTSSSYPSGYSTSYFEAIRSILRDINTKSNSIYQNMHDYSVDIADIGTKAGNIVTGVNNIASNMHDYSVDIADIGTKAGNIVTGVNNIASNMHDYTSDIGDIKTSAGFLSNINNQISSLATESTVTQIGNYLSEGIYTKGQYSLYGNPINFYAGPSSSIIAGSLDLILSQLGSGTPSPYNRRQIVTADSISIDCGDTSYSANLPFSTSAFTYDLVSGEYYTNQFIYSPSRFDKPFYTELENTVRVAFIVPVPIVSLDNSNVCDYLPYNASWELDEPHFYAHNNRVVVFVPKTAIEGYDDIYSYLESNHYTFSLTLQNPYSASLESFTPHMALETTIQANVGNLNLTISSYSPYFQQNINILSSQLSTLSGVSAKLDNISSSTTDLSHVLANQTDVDIRENSTTIINEYNTSFVTGSNGLSSSDITNFADTLGAVKTTLGSDFNFSTVSNVLSNFTNDGLSFWSDDVHSSLNPFGGDENE